MSKPLLDLLIDHDRLMYRILEDIINAEADLVHDKHFLIMKQIERWNKAIDIEMKKLTKESNGEKACVQ